MVCWRGCATTAVACAVSTLLATPPAVALDPSGKLEIHYINIGQGGGTLIIGPDGTTILYDFGDIEDAERITGYLEDTVGLLPDDGFDFTIVSHADRDHYNGFRGVVRAGYDVREANYGNGSDKHRSELMKRNWLAPAADKTSAGAVQPIPIGLVIELGDGARAVVVAANGFVLGESIPGEDEPLSLSDPAPPPGESPYANENDRSIALLIEYGDFDFVIDGDMGDGKEKCSGRNPTRQTVRAQRKVAKSLIGEGLLDQDLGVDVLHVAHHGSESSTSAAYVSLMRPEVALISVGFDNTHDHPRKVVVDRVLLGVEALDSGCPEVTHLTDDRILQTEDGTSKDNHAKASRLASAYGNIRIAVARGVGYVITGDNTVTGGAREAPSTPRLFPFDETGSP